MDSSVFSAIVEGYSDLSIAVLGDFCLDRYLEIDPARQETSLETGLPVYNVMNVRAQPGGAGTIVNNLAALGIGTIYPVGFAGNDGEGFELWGALERIPGVRLSHFVQSVQRRTFTYCKPLVIAPGKPPVELNRLDLKNWTPTPALLQGLLSSRFKAVAEMVDAVIILDQVDVPETGVVTRKVLENVKGVSEQLLDLLILADSRRGLRGFPPVTFKMNAAELSAATGSKSELSLEQIGEAAAALARQNGRNVFVTLSERGILGSTGTGQIEHVPVLPLRGPIDIVGAGDAVTANLAAALAAGANLRESLEIANAAASIVVHKLGTTGTASVPEIRELLCSSAA
ncbi:MAG: PfkB family carbohydrate kinase [Verrucomicrobia bacterium]|nr:PfkB family carbohydrate kinase [Verrucomicrobiota bacterium]